MSVLRFELIIGCMFAGKTSELVRRAKRSESVGCKVLMINHDHDTRTCQSVKTHDGIKVSAVKVSSLTALIGTSFVDDADTICVDEGQFFDDIGTFVESLLRQPKTLIVAALDGNMYAKPWRNITDLVCLADTVTKLSALERLESGAVVEANFSMLLKEDDGSSIKIGGGESYKAVSRETYLKMMDKKHS